MFSLQNRCEQKIIDKCAEMSTNLQQRMDELIASGSVAAVRYFILIFILRKKKLFLCEDFKKN